MKKETRYTSYVCECPVLKKIRIQTGFTRMDPDQVKEARLSNVMALGKGGGGLLNLPYKFK